MITFFQKLFDTGDFPARWHCGNWAPFHGWLHIVSDVLVFAAYMAIPAVLLLFASRRRDLKLPPVFWLFCAFIVSCGVTHLNEAIIFWTPIYRVQGLTKALTAGVSCATVLALVPLLPKALALRTPQELADEVESKTRALRETESRFRHTFEQAAVGIAHVGLDGSWLRVNQRICDIVGYSAEELMGLTFQDITHADDLESDLAQVQAVIADEIQTYNMEKRYIRKDGAITWVQLTVSLVRGDDGEPRHFISVVEDIDRRKRLEAELAAERSRLHEANRALESFAYSVSHDLRAPLRAIDGFSELLREDHSAALGEEGVAHLAVVQRNATKMGELMDGLLSLSRLGSAALRVSRVDMGAMVRGVVDELQQGPHQGQVHVGPLVDAPADATLVQQVWVNLVGNALKYASEREQPEVWISGAEEDGFVVYTVRDNGAGFDPTYGDKLFEVFHRQHKATRFAGSGVGLAIAKRIVVRHGGWIRGEGEVGVGATFRFALPLTSATDAPEESPA